MGKGNKHGIGRKETSLGIGSGRPQRGSKGKAGLAAGNLEQEPGAEVNTVPEPSVLRGHYPCPLCLHPPSSPGATVCSPNQPVGQKQTQTDKYRFLDP